MASRSPAASPANAGSREISDLSSAMAMRFPCDARSPVLF
jgi:hypothetical protein